MSTWFFRPGALLMTALMWLFGPGRTEGLENVPRTGAFIVVANHCSNLDPPFLGAIVGRHLGRVVHFMAKAELRRWPLIGWLANQSGVFFVRRGERDRAAYRLALTHLAAGEIIALFPEGTRSRDGQLKEGRSGAALIAVRSGVPIVPAGISGTHRTFAGRVPHRSRIDIRIGPAFHLPDVGEGQVPHGVLEEGTDRIMREIAALLPPEQRGRWGREPGAA